MANSILNNYPPVSLVIPCRNEKEFIGKCLNSILAADYPENKMEILIVDGMSNDGTRSILEDYTKKHPFIKVLENPELYVSFAMNAGIRHSHGDLIIIMGAHSVYNKDFLIKNVEHIQSHKEVDCVGGICITKAANQRLLSQAIALALSSPFGVGNAYFRIGSKKERYVDTVPFGCYRKAVFAKIGYFDEELTRGQDGEFNARLIKHGGRILLHPDIKSYYFARDSLAKLWRMYFQYGYFKLLASKKIGKVCAPRQFVPPLFVAGLMITLCLSWVSAFFLYGFLFILGTYLLINTAVSFKLSLKDLRYFLVLPIIFLTIHFGWGTGFLKGIVNFIILRKSTRANLKEISLTR